MKFSASYAESGLTSWKGRVTTTISGLGFSHRCSHKHRNPETALKCAEKIARTLTEEHSQ